MLRPPPRAALGPEGREGRLVPEKARPRGRVGQVFREKWKKKKRRTCGRPPAPLKYKYINSHLTRSTPTPLNGPFLLCTKRQPTAPCPVETLISPHSEGNEPDAP